MISGSFSRIPPLCLFGIPLALLKENIPGILTDIIFIKEETIYEKN